MHDSDFFFLFFCPDMNLDSAIQIQVSVLTYLVLEDKFLSEPNVDAFIPASTQQRSRDSFCFWML